MHLAKLADAESMRAWVKPSTDQLHNLSVQGPNSREILRQIVWTPPTQPALEELRWFRFLIGRIGDYDGIPIVVSRTGYTGELGYEVWCHPDDGLAVWDAIWEAGAGHGLKPLGLSALDMLRIESALIFAGYEFDDQVDPFEAGIGFAVALDDEDDFVGKEALVERKAHPQRVLVGLELAGHEVAAHGECVHVGRSQVGVDHQRHAKPGAAQEHRPLPDGGPVRGAGDRGRGRKARRPPEADSRDRGPDPLLRPREEAAAVVVRGVHWRVTRLLDEQGATGPQASASRRPYSPPWKSSGRAPGARRAYSTCPRNSEWSPPQ